jgi:hypothetical protein
VGNAWTDPYWDNKGSVEWFHSHSLISDQTYITVIENCNFTDEFQVDYPVTNAKCDDASYDLYYELDGLDIYNVYVPSCNVPYNSSVRSLMKSVSCKISKSIIYIIKIIDICLCHSYLLLPSLTTSLMTIKRQIKMCLLCPFYILTKIN